jgi:hypothetical protein
MMSAFIYPDDVEWPFKETNNSNSNNNNNGNSYKNNYNMNYNKMKYNKKINNEDEDEDEDEDKKNEENFNGWEKITDCYQNLTMNIYYFEITNGFVFLYRFISFIYNFLIIIK